MFKIFGLFGEMAVLDTLIHGGISHDDPEKYFHTGEQKTKKSIWKEKWSFCFQIKRKIGVIIKKKKKVSVERLCSPKIRQFTKPYENRAVFLWVVRLPPPPPPHPHTPSQEVGDLWHSLKYVVLL